MTWTGSINKKVIAYKNRNHIYKCIMYLLIIQKHTINEHDINNRTPNRQFIEHHEFEQEVLAVNKTEDVNKIYFTSTLKLNNAMTIISISYFLFQLKEVAKTIIIWTGLTYGHEQDLLKFIFDSACRKDNNVFLIPKSMNHVPVLHVENLTRFPCFI